MYSYYGLQSIIMSLRNILIPSAEDDQINVMIFLSLSPCSIFLFPFPILLFSLLPFSPSTTLFFFSSQILRSIVYSHNVSPTIKTISQTSPFYSTFFILSWILWKTVFSPFLPSWSITLELPPGYRTQELNQVRTIKQIGTHPRFLPNPYITDIGHPKIWYAEKIIKIIHR